MDEQNLFEDNFIMDDEPLAGAGEELFAEVEMPEVEVPEMEIPEVETPEVELPEIDMSDIDLSDVDISETPMPEPEIPETEIPEVEIPEVEIPEIEEPGMEFEPGTPDEVREAMERAKKKHDKKSKGKKEKQSKYKRKRAKAGATDTLVRVEELQRIMAKNGGEIDPNVMVSMYIPRRKARRIGAALLRLDKMRIALLLLLLLIMALFIMAFMQEKMGNFTINLDRLEMYRRGISISDSPNFEEPTARLVANAIGDATNTTLADLPDNLDEIDGDHSGNNYVAYTFYVRNAGKENLDYKAYVSIEAASKGAEKAARVAVWKNSERVIYAAPRANGEPEEDCINFIDDKVVCIYEESDFYVGNVDRYTIVIWFEGEDPDCNDSIAGGAIQFAMNIDALENSDSNLLVKFVEDIKDMVTGDGQVINASGTDTPDYYNNDNITWDTRRNQ